MTGARIEPERILKELGALWSGLGSEPQADGSVGVLRAGALTLVTLTADSGRDTVAEGEAYAGLLHEFPGRSIIVRISDAADRSLKARVSAQCWTPFGKRRHICVEQVEIEAGSDGLPDLAPVLRALRAPDLPAILWLREPALLERAETAMLAELFDKVVVNLGGCNEPARMLGRLVEWRGRGALVADLSWTRLTRWRETIAQVFSNPERRRRLQSVASVTVSYYGMEPTIRSAYLLAWFRNIMGGGVEYRLVSAGDRKPCQPGGEVHAAAVSGPGLSLSISQVEGETVELRIGDFAKRLVFHEAGEFELLRQELSIDGRDPVYDAALQSAARYLTPQRSE